MESESRGDNETTTGKKPLSKMEVLWRTAEDETALAVREAKAELLQEAFSSADVGTVKFLLQQGAPVNEALLVLAVDTGDHEKVSLLLKHVVVPISVALLQKELEQEGKLNALLVSSERGKKSPSDADLQFIQSAIRPTIEAASISSLFF